MIGWPGGNRTTATEHGVCIQQAVCPTPDAVASWARHFPIDPKGDFPQTGKLSVAWLSEMVLHIQADGTACPPLRLIMQSTVERDQWRHTFQTNPSFDPLFNWTSSATITLTSRLRPGTAPVEAPAAGILDLAALDDKQLRTRAAGLNLDIDLEESRASLEQRVREAIESPLSAEDEAELP